MVAREDAVLIVWERERLSRHGRFEIQIRSLLLESDRTSRAKRGTDLREAGGLASFQDGEAFTNALSRHTEKPSPKRNLRVLYSGIPTYGPKFNPKAHQLGPTKLGSIS